MKNQTAVSCRIDNGIALISIDDGKRNALSPAVLESIYRALKDAEAANAAVVLTGRAGIFSAGFDIKVMKSGGPKQALNMLRLGYSLTARLMAYPRPVVVACNGHCFAMGVFMMLSADYVVGSQGDFQISANEVAIGLTMPRVAASCLRHRLNPAAYQRAVTLSEVFDPQSAMAAGFFDRLAEPEDLLEEATEQCRKFLDLDQRAHAETKRRIRKETISSIKKDVYLDLRDAAIFALRGAKPKSRIA